MGGKSDTRRRAESKCFSVSELAAKRAMHEGLAVYVLREVITQLRESPGLTYGSARQLRPNRSLVNALVEDLEFGRCVPRRAANSV